MIKLLESVAPDIDHAYQMAREWYAKNPAAQKTRIGHWENLARATAGAESLHEFEQRVRQHLDKAGHDGEQNRWKNPDLTRGLMAELHQAAGAIDSVELLDFVRSGLETLFKEDPAQAKQVQDRWRLELARTFLLAVVRSRKADSREAE